MKAVKKALTFLFNTISILVIVVAVIMLLSVVTSRSGSTPSVFGFSFFRVVTGSMTPELPTDSLVVVQKRDPAQIAPGDVISFYSADPSLFGQVNTHRVVSVTHEEDGELAFETKGDANYIPDKYLTRARDVIGVMVFHSLYLGKALRLVANPLIFLPLIVVPLMVLLIGNLIRTVKYTGVVAHREGEEAAEEARRAVREQYGQTDGPEDPEPPEDKQQE